MNLKPLDPDNESPTLNIHSDASARINSEADSRWFADATHVRFYGDVEKGILGLVPLDSNTEDAYTLQISRGKGKTGGDISLNRLLREAYGVDRDNIDKSFSFDLQWVADHDPPVVVANIRPLLVHCGALEPDSDTEADGGTALPDQVEQTANVLRAAEGCKTVHGLASALDITEDRARALAMETGCYDELVDSPDGYGRPGGKA